MPGHGIACIASNPLVPEKTSSMPQIEDVGGVQGVVQEVGVALKGEAYAIDVAVKYPDPATPLLDYGLLKATQSVAKTFSLVNSGKYAVAYAFHQRGAIMKELFSISPAEGSLVPGAQQSVDLAFNKYDSSSLACCLSIKAAPHLHIDVALDIFLHLAIQLAQLSCLPSLQAHMSGDDICTMPMQEPGAKVRDYSSRQC